MIDWIGSRRPHFEKRKCLKCNEFSVVDCRGFDANKSICVGCYATEVLKIREKAYSYQSKLMLKLCEKYKYVESVEKKGSE